jgi:hypothetical protein
VSVVHRVKDALCWPHPVLLVGTFIAMTVANAAGYKGTATVLACIVGSMAGELDASRRVTKALLSAKGGET